MLFRFDPEGVHHFTIRSLRLLLSIPGMKSLLKAVYGVQDASLKRELWGLTFQNPVGLAAGFDKDALLADWWSTFGFGFVEVGTVTPRPQAGNPKQRLFRLPKDQAVINRMGFNNAGLEAMIARLKKVDRGDLILGANIGKNKDTPNEQAVDDYVKCFEGLFPYVDYFVVNVSSPNTPGLRSLQEKEPLTRLLQTLQDLNQAKDQPKPLLLKIAPDLTDSQLDDIVEVAQTTQLSGLIATNTTISREGLHTPTETVTSIGAGGLSGLPVRSRSQEVVSYLANKTDGTLPLVGVGGIMEPQDAVQRMQAGASLLQVYTGFVYGGPGLVRRLLNGLK
ncbi:MAG: quinone-dependent dihydroorotate dehydrogenase [Bacteroidota bacterium]